MATLFKQGLSNNKLLNKLAICLPSCGTFVVSSKGHGVESLDGPAEETPEATSDGCGDGFRGVGSVERITMINSPKN